MTDDLRTRIIAALDKALPESASDVGFYQRLGVTPLVDIEAYDLNLELLADAVIRELEYRYVLVPKNVTLVQWADEAFKGQSEGNFKHEREPPYGKTGNLRPTATSPNGQQMTDSLRTRIAAVLYERFATAMGFADAAWDDTEHETWLEDADAVIRELNLKEERDRPYSTLHGWQGDWRTRYVTEWEKDDV